VRRARAAAIVAALLVSSAGLNAYLKLGTMAGSKLIGLSWSAFPVRYFITNRDIAGVSAPQLQQAVARALSSWAAVPDVAISSQFVGFTQTAPISGDGMTVIGFQDRPDLDRVLGSTSFTVDAVTGEVIEADIFLNSMFPWSVADGGEAGRQDVESIALHELGHLLGLGHSALGETELIPGGRRVLGAEAVMFPIAFSAGSLNRVLHPDDGAGLSDIYGSDHFRAATGSVTGKVTKDGSGVLGAHVVAFNPATGTLIGGFTLAADGSFTIAGLEPGLHIVRVEPLDDADVASFMDPLGVDVDFKPAIYGRLVAVPRGGTAPSIEVKVSSK
jgi:predicted Zn-dependent protease